jgi:hypothetical protein
VSRRKPLLFRWDGQSCQKFPKVGENDRLDEGVQLVSISSQMAQSKVILKRLIFLSFDSEIYFPKKPRIWTFQTRRSSEKMYGNEISCFGHPTALSKKYSQGEKNINFS